MYDNTKFNSIHHHVDIKQYLLVMSCTLDSDNDTVQDRGEEVEVAANNRSGKG